MKSFPAVIKSPWFTGLIGITCLSLVIWFGLQYIRFGSDNIMISGGIRITLIIVLFFLWIIWRLVAMLRERQHNNQLIEGIQADDNTRESPENNRTQEELSILSDRFRNAMAVLKKTGQSKSLYQMPWYIIIGPPGSGKTTALMNSGLQFPLAGKDAGKESGASVGGIGGTRHCDWWFTDEAILIDTSGRYTTQDSLRTVDNAAWHGFLDLLKKYRRRQPLNGVIVAISLKDLMLQTEEQRNQHARVIRARIDELQDKLGIQFPVYLTLTKIDLVAGFSEFFAGLSQPEREQVWGMTFDLSADNKTSVETYNKRTFSDHYDALVKRLNDRVLALVHHEKDIQRRALIQGFPTRISSLHSIISEFAEQVFSGSQYQKAPLLRGIYFTSGTQEGTPVDRMMASVTASFGLPGDTMGQQVNTGKSFFIKRLLQNVIFSEAGIVGVNRQFESILLWAHRSVLAGLLIVTLGTLALWAGSFARYQLLRTDISAQLDRFNQAFYAAENSPDTPGVLPALNALHSASTVYEQSQMTVPGLPELYDGKVDQNARQLYDNKLLNLFLPALQSELEIQLRHVISDTEQVIDVLRVYLMLVNPVRRDPVMIQEWAEKHWQQTLPGQATAQQQLAGHLHQLLTLDIPPLDSNEKLISAARSEIRQIPVARRIYEQMKREPLMTGDLDFYTMTGSDLETVFAMPQENKPLLIPVRFTADVWKEADFSVDSPLLQAFEQSQWLYGQSDGEDFSRADREKIAEQVRTLYISEYNQFWQTFIQQFPVRSSGNMTEATAQLQILADPVYSPIKSVLELVTANTELTPQSAPSALLEAVSEASPQILVSPRKPTIIDQRFQGIHTQLQSSGGRPAPLNESLELVLELHDYLNDMVLAPDSDEQAYMAARERYQGAGNDIIRRMRSRASRSPEPLKSWLSDLSDNSWKLVLRDTRRHLNSAWKEQVYSPYQRSLKNRYPLVAGQGSEVPLRDFDQFFRPGGIEQQYFDEYLKPFVNTRNWQVKSLDGQNLALSRNTLTQFNQADRIRQSFYQSSGDFMVNFKLQPTRLDSNVRLFSLELGEQRLQYSHGPRTLHSFSWESAASARIIFEDLNGTINQREFDGDWAWFRLLDTSSLKPTSDPREFEITFQQAGRNAQFRLIADSSSNPFNTRLLKNYRPGENL